MNKHLQWAVFGVGGVAIGWVAAGTLRANPLAMAITGLIAGFYLLGALELWRFDQATSALDRALDQTAEPPASLGDWLSQVPESMRSAVRLRIEGDRVALPGPALTPYLVGLLVLLGMLGTFLGMVVTLNGTGIALERATDLPTMRDSLAAPVKGLGLAFGTSVAGVAASAMLGLMSALCRRQRLLVAQRLDARIATALRRFTGAHQREASFELQRQQAQLMPLLVEQLQALTAQMAQQAERSNERLLASQERFQGQAEAAYRGLAASVDQTLQRSLADSARAAAAANQAVVDATMSGIARETAALQRQVAGALQQQLDSFGQTFEQRSAALVDSLASSHAALNERIAGAATKQLAGVATQLDSAVRSVSTAWQDTSARFEQQSVTLLRALDQAHAGLRADLAARDEQRMAAWTEALTAMAGSLQREWQQAGQQTLGQQAQICATLERTAGQIAAQAEAHARSTLAEVARLMQTASEAPRAAAELIAQLREKLTDSLARDHAMLEERNRLMATLDALLGALQHSATEQKTAIAELSGSTSSCLAQAGARFTEKVDAESSRLAAVAAQVTDSAVDVASLGEAFGAAVDLFSQSSDRMMAHLQRVDETLARSITRSDEQLGYYVAQAREVIDLSLMSQKQIVEDLQRIADRRAAVASEA